MKASPAKARRARRTPSRAVRVPRETGVPGTGEIIEMAPLVLRLKRILVPIDFSKTSLKALRYAVPFARQFGAKITLIHVVDFPMYPPELGMVALVGEEARRDVLEHLVAVARHAIPAELRGDTLVRCGVSFDSIVSAAKELHADMIVLTTHGHTGLKHVVLGSTAERVVRHAPCPVFVVREREHEFV